ncbi:MULTISPECIES: GTP-binding protein [unclassified Herbaspirillum]|uniref:CobW family GTP-binding protein n=1 Tax=unclassified Herbaspirillum TaxID=2624150 RepID=UPI00114EE8F8|nr:MULTISPECIES: GTP-binding protein [unclassified Herbaspirillum]MBB5393863.1 G3E family GTPase [Herbaspirillum sp. SJZ102]TQK01283.1 G3E family GTPase [Herbaspirillum sp. SJZ130]TQK05677.1 G3E family GTPase [Herbaspirillum sp. SJZ106]
MNPSVPAGDAPIPVSLLTGFLGSGKTTLLNHLIAQPEMKDTLVIINEFGEIGLDHLLVAHSQEDTVVEMSSGCLCCTIRGDLKKTLKDITWRFAEGGQRKFNRVVIETTGLASPVPILHTLMTDVFIASRYRLDGVIVTVDAVNGMATLDNHVEAVQQAAVADRLLLTKSDLADAAQLAQLRERLRALNPGARQLLPQHGKISPSELLDAGLFKPGEKMPDVARWLNEEAFAGKTAHDHHHHDHGHAHGHDHHDHGHDHHDHAHDVNRHDDHIRAFCFTFDEPIDPALFDEWLSLLVGFKGPNILRIKGILNLKGDDKPTVIHGVQHIFHPTATLPEWPSGDRRSRIVFITRDIERATIERSFDAFMQAQAIEQEERKKQQSAPYGY